MSKEHSKTLLEKRISGFQEAFQTLKSKIKMKTKMANCVIPSIVLPPPSISSIPIPIDILHNQNLLHLWPQLEQQILEMPNWLYLFAYLFENSVQPLRARSANRERLRADIERAIGYYNASEEQVRAHVVSRLELALYFLEQVTAYADQVSCFADQISDRVRSYEDKLRAHVVEEGGSIEWYLKQIEELFASVKTRADSSAATSFKICDVGMVMVQKFVQLIGHVQQRGAADRSPDYPVVEGVDQTFESTLGRVIQLMALSRL
ncbi:hypothetical protein ACP275_11G108600 [Erythranthe tilingii]